MDTGVNNIVGDKYPTASSGWLKVSKQGTAKSLPHLVLFLLCVCVCVCIGLWHCLKFSFIEITGFILGSVTLTVIR